MLWGLGWGQVCCSGQRVMLYLYKVVLGVTGAEGSSEEKVQSLGGLLSPKQLVVLLGIHVQLPMGITPGILWGGEHPVRGEAAGLLWP